MYLACQEGHLSVCKWLYQAGADADITKATRWDAGWTPMLVACQKGHLEVCNWLVEMGAAADVTKATEKRRHSHALRLERVPPHVAAW